MKCQVCDAEMTRESAWVYRCGSCRFLTSILEPGAGADIAGIEALRNENFVTLLDRLEQFTRPPGRRLLEVGCSTGTFLEHARKRGYDPHGIEPSAAAVKTAQQKGFSVECGYFPDDLIQCGPFDFVVFNDVFEHLCNPSSVIGDVERLLNGGGYLVLNLPSSEGILFRLAAMSNCLKLRGPYDRLWQKGLSSPHLSYFNPSNLRMMVKRHTGMELRDEFALRSVSRTGLYDRVRSSHHGAIGFAFFATAWSLSFMLPRLPPDIHVAIFQKPGE